MFSFLLYGCWSLFLIYIKRNNQIHFHRHLWTIETNNSRSGWDPNHHSHAICHSINSRFKKKNPHKIKTQFAGALWMSLFENINVFWNSSQQKDNQHHIRSITRDPQYMGQKNLVKIWNMNDIYLFPRDQRGRIIQRLKEWDFRNFAETNPWTYLYGEDQNQR